MSPKHPYLLALALPLAGCATHAGHVPDPSLATAPCAIVPATMPKHVAEPTATQAALPAADGATRWPDFDASAWMADAAAPQSGRSVKWRDGGALLQGYFGASINNVERSHNGITVEADDVELPSIGGGGQWKLAGDGIDLGLEGMIGFNWRSSSTAFAVGGGGAAVAVDVDLFLLDFYGGPFASTFLGDSLRVYVGAGPLLQWAFYDERSATSEDGNGFGLGYYARTGLEFRVGRTALLGFGVRWAESSIDVGGNLGDIDVDGLLWMVTYSYFY